MSLVRLLFAGVLIAGTPAISVTPQYAYRMVMTPEEGPVDPAVERGYSSALSACQDKAETTSDNARCYADEFARQDARLNAAWQATLTRLDASRRLALVGAQRRWVAERDPFCRRYADEFRGGTIMPVIFHNCRVEQTIRRTTWLEGLPAR